MSEIEELAARVEAAEGPYRLLDAQIAATCRIGAEKWSWADQYPAWEGREDGRVYLEKGGPSYAAPAYTASLDAAMSLVPDAPWEPYGGVTDKWNVVIATAHNSAGVYPTDGASTGIHDKRGGSARASTPVLALCAAALRARADRNPA